MIPDHTGAKRRIVAMLRGELGFGKNGVKIAIEDWLQPADRSSSKPPIRFLGDHVVRKIDLGGHDRSHISLYLVFLVLLGSTLFYVLNLLQLSVFAGHPREWGYGILAEIDV